MRGANVAKEREFAQLFFGPGVVIEVMVLGGVVAEMDDVMRYKTFRKYPQGGSWRDALTPAPFNSPRS
jgi:hypothetical protein